jgi:ubiquinone/menaquinone biosynthesis C-methylase UbiE
VHLVRGDATALPVAHESFDAAMIAFGIRNVVDTRQGLAELHRVLRRDGRLAILEFGLPKDRRLGALYGHIFVTFCRASDDWCRVTATPTNTCRPRSRNSRPVRRLAAC